MVFKIHAVLCELVPIVIPPHLPICPIVIQPRDDNDNWKLLPADLGVNTIVVLAQGTDPHAAYAVYQKGDAARSGARELTQQALQVLFRLVIVETHCVP